MGYAYPVDSKVNIKTDGTIEYDRASNSQDLRGFMKSIITNGIVLKESTNLQVTANEGMKVAVNPGFIVIEGAIKQFEEPIILDVKTSAVYKRVDRIVARLDLNEAVRDIVIDVLQGTEEAEPKKQELTRNSSVYELCLAEVLVEGGSTEIKQSNITDTRLLNDVCGMCSSLAEIDTQTLYTQMTTQFDEWFANVKTQLDGDVAGNLQNQIDESKIAENNYFDKNISGLNADNVQGAIDELKGAIGYTSKNLLVNPASNATVNGNVFTANADKSFTVTGTSGTGVTQYYFVQPLKKGKYIASGCPQGGSTSSYWVYVSANNNVLGYDFGEGVEFELEEDTSVTYCMRIFSNGYKANSLVFKPMIRPASIKDDTYETYKLTVRSSVFDLEKIEYSKNMTTPVAETRYYTYKATRRCIINLSFSACFGVTGAKSLTIYKNDTTACSSYDKDGASLTGSVNLILEAGDEVRCNAAYVAENTNGIRILGYVQYLE